MHLSPFNLVHDEKLPPEPTIVFQKSKTESAIDFHEKYESDSNDVRLLMNAEDFSIGKLIETNALSNLKPCIIQTGKITANDFAERAFSEQASKTVEPNE